MRMFVAAAALVLALAGCGGGDGAVLGGGGPAEPAPAPTAGLTDGSGQGPARRFCTFLQEEVPRVSEVESRVVALARFVGDYGSWLTEDAQRILTDAAELDNLARDGCPQDRERLLDLLQSDSLVQILGD